MADVVAQLHRDTAIAPRVPKDGFHLWVALKTLCHIGHLVLDGPCRREVISILETGLLAPQRLPVVDKPCRAQDGLAADLGFELLGSQRSL